MLKPFWVNLTYHLTEPYTNLNHNGVELIVCTSFLMPIIQGFKLMKRLHTSDLLGLFWIIFPFLGLVLACESTWKLERENLFSTGQLINIADTNAQVRGEIIDQNLQKPVLSYGHCWSTEPNPDLNDFFQAAEAEFSPRSFTVTLNRLSPQTEYFVRAFIEEAGEVRFGEEINFTTRVETLPFDLQIRSVFDISRNSASAEATLAFRDTSNSNLDIISYGFVWGTSDRPELGAVGADSTVKAPSATVNSFVCDLVALQADTQYFIRPFLKWRGNNLETRLSYGDGLRFNTLE